MNDIKIPGVLWVVLIVLGVTAVEQYVEDPLVVEITLIAALALLKYLSLGTGDIEKVIEIAEDLRRRLSIEASERQRSFPSVTTAAAEPTVPQQAFKLDDYKPNKIIRFLLG